MTAVRFEDTVGLFYSQREEAGCRYSWKGSHQNAHPGWRFVLARVCFFPTRHLKFPRFKQFSLGFSLLPGSAPLHNQLQGEETLPSVAPVLTAKPQSWHDTWRSRAEGMRNGQSVRLPLKVPKADRHTRVRMLPITVKVIAPVKGELLRAGPPGEGSGSQWRGLRSQASQKHLRVEKLQPERLNVPANLIQDAISVFFFKCHSLTVLAVS